LTQIDAKLTKHFKALLSKCLDHPKSTVFTSQPEVLELLDVNLPLYPDYLQTRIRGMTEGSTLAMLDDLLSDISDQTISVFSFADLKYHLDQMC
jgi:hypothetical protein